MRAGLEGEEGGGRVCATVVLAVCDDEDDVVYAALALKVPFQPVVLLITSNNNK